MTITDPELDVAGPAAPVLDVADRARARAGKCGKYEVNVMASRVPDVVSSAGGWLFDLQMAGWDVNVLVADHSNERALQILGARTLDLHGLVTRDPHRAAFLVVAADLCSTDERVREQVLRAVRRGTTDVALWGVTGGWQLGARVDAVEHRLSGAARAFKAHALAATGMRAESVGLTETLFRCGAATCLRMHSDPVPVS
jgi:hypothetical protein